MTSSIGPSLASSSLRILPTSRSSAGVFEGIKKGGNGMDDPLSPCRGQAWRVGPLDLLPEIIRKCLRIARPPFDRCLDTSGSLFRTGRVEKARVYTQRGGNRIDRIERGVLEPALQLRDPWPVRIEDCPERLLTQSLP